MTRKLRNYKIHTYFAGTMNKNQLCLWG